MTSIFEGSPNVLVEALFLKKFVISTNCPTGPNEILKNGKFGALFKVGDYKNISKFINNFKFNKKTNKKIINGYKSTKRFNYFENCGKYSSLIQSYLNLKWKKFLSVGLEDLAGGHLTKYFVEQKKFDIICVDINHLNIGSKYLMIVKLFFDLKILNPV